MKTDDRDFSESERQAFKAHGRKAVKTAAEYVMASPAWERLNDLHASGVRYTRRVGNYCAQCGQPVVDVLENTPLSDYAIGLITHAMHTNDGGEIIRLITRLSEKGRM
ncbi:MAG: hypothetical protein SOI13_05260 [Bifidobacterium mongoliense]|jgi:hypothetical protein|uniref:hypothetical protein n=1 Tax=Bifidobacterium mongoliense TaxID=518643 RepID=UPI002F354ED1